MFLAAFLSLLFVLCSTCPQGGASKAMSMWDNACRWGGLIVKKGNQELTTIKCNAIFAKEDWQPPQPEITYPSADPEKIYTVFVLDPDAPNHPNGTYYLHMLQANVKGSDLIKGDFSKATLIADYVGPAPPEGTGLHRYMFIVYQNEPDFTVEKTATPERWMFNLVNWLVERGKGLIGPEAGVQFQAGYSLN